MRLIERPMRTKMARMMENAKDFGLGVFDIGRGEMQGHMIIQQRPQKEDDKGRDDVSGFRVHGGSITGWTEFWERKWPIERLFNPLKESESQSASPRHS